MNEDDIYFPLEPEDFPVFNLSLPGGTFMSLSKVYEGPTNHRIDIASLNHDPKQSMYGILTYIYHKHQLNVGKYTIHGWYGDGFSFHQGRYSGRVTCCVSSQHVGPVKVIGFPGFNLPLI